MRLISWLLLNLLFAAAAFSQTDPATLPQVEFFSPQGTVKGVRQVAARFSTATERTNPILFPIARYTIRLDECPLII